MDTSLAVNYSIFGIFFIWLIIVSFFLYKTRSHYNHLTKNTHSKQLSDALDILIRSVQSQKEHAKELDKRITKLEKESQFHIQKIGLVRFNPFADTGGEQSFIIALLDNTDSGIVLTSLQGRTGVRWYTKWVKDAKGVKYELSKEETEAVKKAKPLH
jgi:hypothetical protein